MAPKPVAISQVERLVERWFPDTATAIERIAEGSSTPVYRLLVAGDPSYLRLAEAPGEDRVGEVTAHRLALAAGVSVPDILRFEASPQDLDRSAALTSAMPGIPLSAWPNPIPNQTTDAIAADLVRLNGIPVQGFGWIHDVAEDGGLVADYPTREAWTEEYRRAAERILTAGVFPPATAKALIGAVSAWADLPDGPTSHLAHGDFDPSHIYADPVTCRYHGLIDFGEIRGADRLYDLGHLVSHAFAPADQDLAHRIVERVSTITPVDRDELRLQAVAIASRALAIQLTRPMNAYRTSLIIRLNELLDP